jgi:hypothetical protein
LALLVAASICLAGDLPATDPPRSPAGKAAITKFETAKAKADAAYKLAIGKALQTEIADLDAARQAAMKNQNFDEAERCDVAKKDAQAGSSPQGTIEVTRAQFGVEGQTIDVTSQARTWLKGSTLKLPDHIWKEVKHDWPGRGKWLDITIRSNGASTTFHIPDDFGISLSVADTAGKL